MATSIQHTYRRSGIFYCRFRLPQPIRDTAEELGLQTEFRFSLQTHDQIEAKRRISIKSRQLYDFIDFFIDCDRVELKSELSKHHQRMVVALKEKEFTMSRKHSFYKKNHIPVKPLQQDPDHHSETLIKRAKYTRLFQPTAVLPTSLDSPFTLLFKKRQEETAEDWDTAVNTAYVDHYSSDAYRIYSDAPDPNIAAQEVFALDSFYQRSLESDPKTSLRPDLTDNRKTLAECMTGFVEEQKRLKWTNDSTAQRGITRLTLLVDKLGPQEEIGKLNEDMLRSIEQEFIDRTTAETSRRGRLKTDQSLAITTSKHYMQLLKTFISWCWKKRYIKEDLSSEVGELFKASTPRKVKSKAYKAFTTEDLSKIFTRYLYVGEDLPKKRTILDSYLWAPVIGLFTGMRLNEICQLRIQDIKEENGIWFFDCSESGEAQSIKNESSCRRVPIHEQLIRIGLLDFLQDRLGDHGKEAMLFRDLKYDPKNHWIKQTSRWFLGESKVKGYLDLVEIENRDGKVFHSFRHTFVGQLRRQGLGNGEIAALVGHEKRSMTDHYGGGYDLETLKMMIDRLSYPIDLSHINYEKLRYFQLAEGKPSALSHIADVRLKKLNDKKR